MGLTLYHRSAGQVHLGTYKYTASTPFTTDLQAKYTQAPESIQQVHPSPQTCRPSTPGHLKVYNKYTLHHRPAGQVHPGTWKYTTSTPFTTDLQAKYTRAPESIQQVHPSPQTCRPSIPGYLQIYVIYIITNSSCSVDHSLAANTSRGDNSQLLFHTLAHRSAADRSMEKLSAWYGLLEQSFCTVSRMVDRHKQPI